MSNPANSLASFRSYSYYHVLCMCDSSATADLLAKSTSLDIWDHASEGNRVEGVADLGKYSVKCINNTGKYVVLINGATDAAYVITEAKWTTVTAAAAVPGDKGTSLAVEGSISISEPKGIAFLDQIIKCSIALGVDSSQVVYVLKTFFVGHRDEIKLGGDSDYEYYITDIPPLNCIVYDVTGSFTEQGGAYKMDFVSLANGASRLPQYSKLAYACSLTAGSTLKETFQLLQDNINRSYEGYFKCVQEQIAAARGVDPSDVLGLLRPVKYVIAVGKEYEDSRYTVTDQPVQAKNGSSCDAPAQLSFQPGTSIESAINSIMNASLQVKEDMCNGSPTHEFKVHSTIISSPAGGGGSASGSCTSTQQFDYTVYYRVERFPTPKSVTQTSQFELLQKDDSELRNDPKFAQIRNNIIEFDYIYTGKNIDILEFDMKVNHGLAYLQTATLANTFKSQLERAPNKQTKASNSDVETATVRFGGDAVQIPVFFGTQIKKSLVQNSQNLAVTVDSQYTLTKHSSLEVAEAQMRIIGNDQLLRMTNRATSSQFTTTDSKQLWNNQNASDSSDQQFKDWGRVPTFAKVNIKMPRNNDDTSLYTGQTSSGTESQDYAQDFWFDGYYYIHTVEHVFNQGEFTQTLEMIALPKKSAFASTQGANTTAKVNANIGDCYDSKIPCRPTPTAVVPPTSPTKNESTAGGGRGVVNPPWVRPDTSGMPTNTQDAVSSASGRSLSDVPGWNTAKPEVQAAVVNAANRYGVNPVTLATMVQKESNFNPSAKAGTSSATGLGQFIDSTWLGQVQKDRSIGVDPTASKSAQLAARYDPQTSANATASFMVDNIRTVGSADPGDVYLAHFAGPGTAKKIIGADKLGQGNTPLKQVVGTETFNKMRAANKSIITRDDYTAGELRSWAATKMALGPKKPGTSTKNVTSASPTVAVSSPQERPREAREAVAAVTDCAAQEQKKDTKPCGPNATNTA